MRLTDKMGIAYEVEDFSNCYEAVDKLGRLEDIEEKIGIDFIILFKALTEGIYLKQGYNFFKNYPNEKWAIIRFENNIAYFKGSVDVALFERYKGTGNRYEVKNCEYCPFDEIEKSDISGLWEKTSIELKDYGKTWALTKEELEN